MQDGEIVPPKKETNKQQLPVQFNSVQIREKIESFLVNRNLHYDFKPDKNAFYLKFKNSTDEFSSIDLQITMWEHSLLFSIIYYEDVPTNKTTQISELIARVNCYILSGHFNFYYKERLIAHRNYLLLADVYFTDELLDSYVEKSIRLFEKFQPIILKVIENNEEPILALLDFEMNN